VILNAVVVVVVAVVGDSVVNNNNYQRFLVRSKALQWILKSQREML
jgi:hypothetical protein